MATFDVINGNNFLLVYGLYESIKTIRDKFSNLGIVRISWYMSGECCTQDIQGI